MEVFQIHEPFGRFGRLSTYLEAFSGLCHPNINDHANEGQEDVVKLERRRKLKSSEYAGGAMAAVNFSFGSSISFNSPLINQSLESTESRFSHLVSYDLGAQDTLDCAQLQASSSHDLLWLEEQVEAFYQKDSPIGMSKPEFCLTLVNLLSSDRSSDDLQTELFDLIGFEKFDLIQLLLQHRPELVQSKQDNQKSLMNEIAISSKAASLVQQQQQRPTYGCQVLVQTEQERVLKKQMRKEEKRLKRILNRNGKEEDSDSNDEFAFDPSLLRAKRSEELAKAMSRPLFSSSSQQTGAIPVLSTSETLPFVFDSYAKARTTPGFIQGVKMSLPIGFERDDTKKYEEISIPASGASQVDLVDKLVLIKDLDPVGQVAFQGMKSLNRIQSVVFNSAFGTNENMLVCAPTGAGKTNVAMLCVVQAIRQHMENDVIKKDTFKMVYVAPMKALAAEMTETFGKRLAPLGLKVRELTGDMQLTKNEIMETQMLVTTPEKWDVVTRKPGDVSLTQLVRLLIIDEVHLLHGDRGPVIEALVARTLRLVESTQTVIRVVGLSATLPNYMDVAEFLSVNPYLGLFFFDGRFRPVPLSQTFVGIKSDRPQQQMVDIDEVCYDKVAKFVRQGHQVMVFVHARNSTVTSAMKMMETARNLGDTQLFLPEDSVQYGTAQKAVSKSRNLKLVELFQAGFGIHHAGMLRSDRNLVEKLFSQGFIKVLCCTATLAWGVNLPAHAVIIKGTEIYDAKHGGFVDIGILDVLQIFGRAGRPQFDSSGHGTIITTHKKLPHYLSLLTNQFPIESNFIAFLADNLNAEVSLGTVTTIDEAVQWLAYTYLYVRMRKNPLVYGLQPQDVKKDPTLDAKRRSLATEVAQKLDRAKMIRFDQRTGYLHATDLGRTASHFYIKYDTVEIFNTLLKPIMNEAEILAMISQASEFEQLKVRDEELDELDYLIREFCHVQPAGGPENVHGKVNILLQCHISRGRVNAFSLISDQAYVVTNASRITRALFEIVLKKNWPLLAGRLLKMSKCIERQMWDFETPLRQNPNIKYEVLDKLESRNFTLDKLRESESKDIGLMLHHVKIGSDVKKAAHEVPRVELEALVQPITRTVLRVKLTIKPDFRWNDRLHGYTSEPYYVWVEDPDNNHIYHHEYLQLSKKLVLQRAPLELVFTIPIFEPLPAQYYVRCISDRWVGCETYHAISFQHLILPDHHPPMTDLLDLQPLPVTALRNSRFEQLYPFTHFNPIQTQVFHTLYHTGTNVLLGAPTGSGKTIAAEIAMMAVFRDHPEGKVVYIAPLKALVSERISDWKIRLEKKLKLPVVELTGDASPDARAIRSARVIVTTPEKWDGISRSWQTRNYVQAVRLIVIDEIHLLGEDRGPVLEVIVSRTNFISSHTSRSVRLIGLSTALPNARDLANWLGIHTHCGLFNFRPSVRPVPLEVHISGFSGKHYCPRMATMNKPTFQAIQQHSPSKPALVFVASRRQTRLTALDLIAFLALEPNPKMWLKMDEHEMDNITQGVKDQHLRLTLAFGIGMHHAGLVERDRKIVEELFVNQKIQVLIATATVAWGVNFPAHLVVIKGTEYYDGKQKRYVDMPITDVLQMMGRAGRPQFDDNGIACVLVHDVKKHFYKKFLYEPMPVESSLLNVLPDHLNAEIVAGTLRTPQDVLDYLTWTYLFRRLLQNPGYYGLQGVDETNLNSFLTGIVSNALRQLQDSSCIEFCPDGDVLEATTMGRISSYYYLSHETLRGFMQTMGPNMSLEQVLQVLSDATEYSQLPVRHNEDLLNAQLSQQCPIDMSQQPMNSSNVKAHLLLQSHFSRLSLPCSDYVTDTKSVLDQAIRILQAMIDLAAENGWLGTTLQIQTLMQMIVQARWHNQSGLLTLPHLEPHMLYLFQGKQPMTTIPQLQSHCNGNYQRVAALLRPELNETCIEDVFQTLMGLPRIHVRLSIKAPDQDEMVIDQTPNVSWQEIKWVRLLPDQEYVLCIELARTKAASNWQPHSKAIAPKFPKPKDAGWFLVLANVDQGEDLMALKRVPAGVHKHQITFVTPDKPGRLVLTLYVMSDSYLDLDQQYDIHLDLQSDALS